MGLGGSYSSSGYRAGEIDYNFPLLTKGTWSPESTALGIAGFGLAGVRFAAPGMYLGIEGQISSPSYSEKSVVRSVTFSSSSDFFETSYEAELSSRFSASATVFFPIADIELYGRAGLAYSNLTERLSVVAAGPVISYYTLDGLTYVLEPYSLSPVSFEREHNLLSPFAALGVQVPIGYFFLRLEAELEIAQLPDLVFSADSPLTTKSGRAPLAFSPVHLNGSITGGTVLPRFSMSLGAKF